MANRIAPGADLGIVAISSDHVDGKGTCRGCRGLRGLVARSIATSATSSLKLLRSCFTEGLPRRRGAADVVVVAGAGLLSRRAPACRGLRGPIVGLWSGLRQSVRRTVRDPRLVHAPNASQVGETVVPTASVSRYARYIHREKGDIRRLRQCTGLYALTLRGASRGRAGFGGSRRARRLSPTGRRGYLVTVLNDGFFNEFVNSHPGNRRALA